MDIPTAESYARIGSGRSPFRGGFEEKPIGNPLGIPSILRDSEPKAFEAKVVQTCAWPFFYRGFQQPSNRRVNNLVREMGMRNGMTPIKTIQLLLSFKGIPGFIPTFPTEHQQDNKCCAVFWYACARWELNRLRKAPTRSYVVCVCVWVFWYADYARSKADAVSTPWTISYFTDQSEVFCLDTSVAVNDLL